MCVVPACARNRRGGAWPDLARRRRHECRTEPAARPVRVPVLPRRQGRRAVARRARMRNERRRTDTCRTPHGRRPDRHRPAPDRPVTSRRGAMADGMRLAGPSRSVRADQGRHHPRPAPPFRDTQDRRRRRTAQRRRRCGRARSPCRAELVGAQLPDRRPANCLPRRARHDRQSARSVVGLRRVTCAVPWHPVPVRTRSRAPHGVDAGALAQWRQNGPASRRRPPPRVLAALGADDRAVTGHHDRPP